MNNIEQFLFKQVRKFCSEADDSMFPVELYKSYEEVINFIISEVEKEVGNKSLEHSCNLGYGEDCVCNALAFGKTIQKSDISTIINNLRVK